MAGHDGPLRDSAPPENLVDQQALQRAETEAWAAFRAAHPARFATQLLARRNQGRPGKQEQSAWTIYTYNRKRRQTAFIHQQWLVVPTLVAQPLAGAQPIDGYHRTSPYRTPCGQEHVTNIFRMEALLGEHPEVQMLHDSVHPSMQLQSIDDLLQPYQQSLSSSARIFDMHSDMPSIQHYQIPTFFLLASNLLH